MGIKPQVVNAAMAAIRPEVSCDSSERSRSPQDESDRLADKIDIVELYRLYRRLCQAPVFGSAFVAANAAITAWLRQRAANGATLPRPASRARAMQRNPHA